MSASFVANTKHFMHIIVCYFFINKTVIGICNKNSIETSYI